jgi:hypothetical protein
MKVGQFGRLGKSENLGVQEIWEVGRFWKDWEGGTIGRILSPVIYVFLLLHVDCVIFHSGDYRTERPVHSIILVLHVAIHSNIIIYYSVVLHVRILGKNLSGARTQLLEFHLIGTRSISRFGRSESL